MELKKNFVYFPYDGLCDLEKKVLSWLMYDFAIKTILWDRFDLNQIDSLDASDEIKYLLKSYLGMRVKDIHWILEKEWHYLMPKETFKIVNHKKLVTTGLSEKMLIQYHIDKTNLKLVVDQFGENDTQSKDLRNNVKDYTIYYGLEKKLNISKSDSLQDIEDKISAILERDISFSKPDHSLHKTRFKRLHVY